eukprot:TRINITY_DN2503_c0_g1_i1.p1 TRINITY_DN2503_c0_g1~~TRINITY_DN2503_c0_g1_i1.p1  ORF type:complete len:1163 (+),score=568.10 TRINITY_DN2503_c0_g1_i1:330-3818(+)
MEEPIVRMQVLQQSLRSWVHLDAFSSEVVGLYVRVSFDKGSFVVARINEVLLGRSYEVDGVEVFYHLLLNNFTQPPRLFRITAVSEEKLTANEVAMWKATMALLQMPIPDNMDAQDAEKRVQYLNTQSQTQPQKKSKAGPAQKVEEKVPLRTGTAKSIEESKISRVNPLELKMRRDEFKRRSLQFESKEVLNTIGSTPPGSGLASSSGSSSSSSSSASPTVSASGSPSSSPTSSPGATKRVINAKRASAKLASCNVNRASSGEGAPKASESVELKEPSYPPPPPPSESPEPSPPKTAPPPAPKDEVAPVVIDKKKTASPKRKYDDDDDDTDDEFDEEATVEDMSFKASPRKLVSDLALEPLFLVPPVQPPPSTPENDPPLSPARMVSPRVKTDGVDLEDFKKEQKKIEKLASPRATPAESPTIEEKITPPDEDKPDARSQSPARVSASASPSTAPATPSAAGGAPPSPSVPAASSSKAKKSKSKFGLKLDALNPSKKSKSKNASAVSSSPNTPASASSSSSSSSPVSASATSSLASTPTSGSLSAKEKEKEETIKSPRSGKSSNPISELVRKRPKSLMFTPKKRGGRRESDDKTRLSNSFDLEKLNAGLQEEREKEERAQKLLLEQQAQAAASSSSSSSSSSSGDSPKKLSRSGDQSPHRPATPTATSEDSRKNEAAVLSALTLVNDSDDFDSDDSLTSSGGLRFNEGSTDSLKASSGSDDNLSNSSPLVDRYSKGRSATVCGPLPALSAAPLEPIDPSTIVVEPIEAPFATRPFLPDILPISVSMMTMWNERKTKSIEKQERQQKREKDLLEQEDIAALQEMATVALAEINKLDKDHEKESLEMQHRIQSEQQQLTEQMQMTKKKVAKREREKNKKAEMELQDRINREQQQKRGEFDRQMATLNKQRKKGKNQKKFVDDDLMSKLEQIHKAHNLRLTHEKRKEEQHLIEEQEIEELTRNQSIEKENLLAYQKQQRDILFQQLSVQSRQRRQKRWALLSQQQARTHALQRQQERMMQLDFRHELEQQELNQKLLQLQIQLETDSSSKSMATYEKTAKDHLSTAHKREIKELHLHLKQVQKEKGLTKDEIREREDELTKKLKLQEDQSIHTLEESRFGEAEKLRRRQEYQVAYQTKEHKLRRDLLNVYHQRMKNVLQEQHTHS